MNPRWQHVCICVCVYACLKSFLVRLLFFEVRFFISEDRSSFYIFYVARDFILTLKAFFADCAGLCCHSERGEDAGSFGLYWIEFLLISSLKESAYFYTIAQVA